MDQFGAASLARFGVAPNKGARRNSQLRRQRHLLKIRAALLPFGVPSLLQYGFVDCDYDTLVFTLAEDDIKETRVDASADQFRSVFFPTLATAATTTIALSDPIDDSGEADQVFSSSVFPTSDMAISASTTSALDDPIDDSEKADQLFVLCFSYQRSNNNSRDSALLGAR